MLVSLAELQGEIEHRFALCFAGRLSQALRDRGVAVSFLGAVRLRSPWSAWRARRALRRLIAQGDFDAVICHGIWAYCVFSGAIRRARQSPVLYLHDIPEASSFYYRFAWRKPPALCIANSAYTAERLSALSPVPTRIVHPLVEPPAPVTPERAEELRVRWAPRDAGAIILQASRLDSWKGHRNLLRALGTVRDEPGWHCWIAGTPQRPEEEAYRQELVRTLEALGIARRVTFIGHRDDMPLVLRACDIYCQPNESPEPFGMVFVEALYAGKPVVATSLGGALEIVTDECGILCSPEPAPLRDALLRLIADPSLRERLAHAGPARARGLCGPESFTRSFQAALASVKLVRD